MADSDLDLLREMFAEAKADIRAWREADGNPAAIVAQRKQLLDLLQQIRALEEAEAPSLDYSDLPSVAERIRLLLRNPEIAALVNADAS